MILWGLLLFSTLSWTQVPDAQVATPPAAHLVVEVTLVDFTWAELNLQHESSFTQPLHTNWQKILQENSPDKEIKSCQGPCKVYFDAWLDRGPGLLNPAHKDEYTDGQWIKVFFNVSRDPASKRFSWEGRVLLQDINSKVLLQSFDLGREEKNWDSLSQKQLNSALATRLYQSALPALKQIGSKLKIELPYTRASRLVIKDAPLMSHAQELVNLLKARGTSLGLHCDWKAMASRISQFICFYQGEEKTFSDLLSSVKELKSSKSYNLGHEVVGTEHVLTFKP